ncbi:VCBS repeat-containing protein [Anabaena sp. UHCC 0399]|uniref:FG-GAP repeat domain-containing protein n=1 Tax=Anabaena sp. UHCC 0399 TaxID=3110238 RepID=UPI002B1F9856|nr:VCBS repeat-containing protein [Anabaena sp. UHCC 0399]MEA5564907.1 VCBS repeat-containing protein [Anabaena sp. UHCC 0399]
MSSAPEFNNKVANAFDISLQKSQSLINPSQGLSDFNITLPTNNSSSPEPSPLDFLPQSPFTTVNPNPNPYLTSAAITPDFNGDGKADKVWVNTQTGEIVVRLMDGATTVQEASLGQYDLTTWSYKIADFNSDGKTDFLLRNNATGENAVALMDGTRVANFVYLEKVDAGWEAKIGDFNGDRKTDIYWHNATTGQNAIWTMDGTTVTSANVLDTTDVGWNPTIVDFDGNGKSDIFWRNTATGENNAWFMDGAQSTKYDLQAQDSSWSYTLGDFNGDFKTDILWRNTSTGENKVWTMNVLPGVGPLVTEGTLNTLDSSWKASIGDFNGDGKTDIFWNNETTGENTAWLMDGTNKSSEAFLPKVSETGAVYQPFLGDHNGDGKTDIYWRDQASGQDVLWVMDGTTATATPVANSLTPEWYTG